MKKSFITYNNRQYPYKVTISNIVEIYKYDKFLESGNEINNLNDILKHISFENNPSHKLLYKELFIGESIECEITINSGCYGSQFDGNSILIKNEDNSYTYIGDVIKQFNVKSDITKFYSPIGNNLVPYSFALDKDNNCYLFADDKIILSCEQTLNFDIKSNPYSMQVRNELKEDLVIRIIF